MDILTQQTEIIQLLQKDALSRINSQAPPSETQTRLENINEAGELLSSVTLGNILQLQNERDLAVGYLNRLLFKLLGIEENMSVLDQAMLGRVVAAEQKIDELRNASTKLTEVQAALESEQSQHATDVKEVVDKLNEILSHVDGASSPTPTPPNPPTSAPTAPDSPTEDTV